MKKILIALSLFILVVGCGPRLEDTPRVGYGDDGLDDKRVTLDAGDFTVMAPTGWVFTPKMGIDSTVGEFSGNGMTLIFDLGMYTGDFTNNSVYFEDPTVYTVTEATIDGLKSKIYVPVVSSGEKPTVLSIENPKGAEPCTEEVCPLNQENFEMLGDSLNEEQVALALEIFRSVDFK